jgi:thiosulfate/3-mercaptopyruvate sulfurtransferase
MDALVSAGWVAERLGEVLVLDATLAPPGSGVDTRGRYREAHLPGAIFFDIEAFSDETSDLPHMLLGADEFSRRLGALGVGRERMIVVYEQEGVFSAPRARWMLRVAGAERVFLLDGGLRAWREAGLPMESGEVRLPGAQFPVAMAPDSVTDFFGVTQALEAGGQVLDARSAARFSGEAAEPRAGLSSGHMPGARNLPYTDLIRDGRFKTGEELRVEFAKRGIDLERPVVTTCGSGVTAAVLALGLEQVGAEQVSLYDGSWTEYAQRPGARIATKR